VIPQGLIETPVEKNVGPSQMAEFSTSLDEIVPPMSGPAMAMHQAQAPQVSLQPAPQASAPHQQGGPKKIPFGLTVQQYMALLAGLAAVVATSKPVQERLSQFFPNIEPGSMYAALVTALIAALVFYAAEKFL
jgi:hypothetical protein